MQKSLRFVNCGGHKKGDLYDTDSKIYVIEFFVLFDRI